MDIERSVHPGAPCAPPWLSRNRLSVSRRRDPTNGSSMQERRPQPSRTPVV